MTTGRDYDLLVVAFAASAASSCFAEAQVHFKLGKAYWGLLFQTGRDGSNGTGWMFRIGSHVL